MPRRPGPRRRGWRPEHQRRGRGKGRALRAGPGRVGRISAPPAYRMLTGIFGSSARAEQPGRRPRRAKTRPVSDPVGNFAGMTDAEQVVAAYWAAAEARDWETFGSLVAEDVVYEAAQRSEERRV